MGDSSCVAAGWREGEARWEDGEDGNGVGASGVGKVDLSKGFRSSIALLRRSGCDVSRLGGGGAAIV